MKLSSKNIVVETSEQGELQSIKYQDVDILHDGKEWWQKIGPIIWPNTSFSHGFVVKGKNYELPKHGFWKELDWNQMYEGETLSMVATHMADERYPFTIDIQNNISIKDNKVIFKTVFSNLGKEEAYFNFGHHTAFKIDANSEVVMNTNAKPQMIDKTGKLLKNKVDVIKLMDMDFGGEYDTLVYKDVDFNEATIKRNGLYVTVGWDGFNSMQLWKPKDALFLCIEPWQGWNDPEYAAPKEAKEKLETIILGSGETIEKVMTIEIKKHN